MPTPAGTITIPIVAKWGGKEFPIGEVTMDVKVSNGRPKAPTAREIERAIKKGLR